MRSTLPPCRQVTSSIFGAASATSHIDRMSRGSSVISEEIQVSSFFVPPGRHGNSRGESVYLVSDTNRVITSASVGQYRQRIVDRMLLFCPRNPVVLCCSPSEGWASPFRIEYDALFSLVGFCLDPAISNGIIIYRKLLHPDGQCCQVKNYI